MSVSEPPVLLESGDRLSRDEFHRRYCLRPDIKRAELVQGVVYVPSPTRFGVHDRQHAFVIGWLVVFAARTAGVEVGSDATIFLAPDTEVQPDGFLFRVPPLGPGAARIRSDSYIEGAPQLVVEVAASS